MPICLLYHVESIHKAMIIFMYRDSRNTVGQHRLIAPYQLSLRDRPSMAAVCVGRRRACVVTRSMVSADDVAGGRGCRHRRFLPHLPAALFRCRTIHTAAAAAAWRAVGQPVGQLAHTSLGRTTL